jgi:hypothetical protein
MIMKWLDEEEERRVMVQMLEASDPVGSAAIEEETGMCQWGVFEAAMELLSKGYPVSVVHCEGSWLNFTESEAELSYRLGKTQKDLTEMREMVDTQLSYLSRIRSGIEVAQERLAVPCDAPTTEDLTAGP